jgi:hypothetical protein
MQPANHQPGGERELRTAASQTGEQVLGWGDDKVVSQRIVIKGESERKWSGLEEPQCGAAIFRGLRVRLLRGYDVWWSWRLLRLTFDGHGYSWGWPNISVSFPASDTPMYTTQTADAGLGARQHHILGCSLGLMACLYAGTRIGGAGVLVLSRRSHSKVYLICMVCWSSYAV